MKNKILNYIEQNHLKVIGISFGINLLLFLAVALNQSNKSVVVANVAGITDNKPVSIAYTIVPTKNSLNVIYVEVVGEVKNPGIYKINKPLMLLELIDLAGGLTSDADLDYLHKSLPLSKIVANNDKIYIPKLGGVANTSSQSVSTSLININTASLTELDELPGVGAATAQKIIAGRPYSTLDDLKSLDGISDSLYNKIVSLITL